ncbi:hypothetical protein DCS_05004 [Drechmeria coniospora]|uniref:Uncharacterized protein n=1 Tax=Drechmeria coniospora TaxID=98403 RepID=A0A151GLS6_DRECN|nr:hypothetical protein DCS_05004 [Drechmeria coniospora]KYK57991.1 hypothetical protein DCS_05004 [Drechmeria coniospora]
MDKGKPEEINLQQVIEDFMERTEDESGIPRARIKRKPIPVGDPYDGNKGTFAAWKFCIDRKLRVDKDFIGSAQDQWIFVWQNLSAKVQQRVTTYFKEGSRIGYDPFQFLTYLESAYSDPYC